MSNFFPTSTELSKEEIESYMTKATEGMHYLLNDVNDDAVNADGNPWNLDFEKKELQLKVFSSLSKTSAQFKRFKAVCFLHIHLTTFTPLLRTIRIERTLVRRDVEKGRTVVILRCGTKPVGPISARDFYDSTLSMKGADGSWVEAGAGIDCDGRFPPARGFVRGYNFPGSGWMMTPVYSTSSEGGSGSIPMGCKMTYIIQTDLKGWFLPLIVNQAIGGSYCAFFEDLKTAMSKR
eukprot:gene31454-41943_t